MTCGSRGAIETGSPPDAPDRAKNLWLIRGQVPAFRAAWEAGGQGRPSSCSILRPLTSRLICPHLRRRPGHPWAGAGRWSYGHAGRVHDGTSRADHIDSGGYAENLGSRVFLGARLRARALAPPGRPRPAFPPFCRPSNRPELGAPRPRRPDETPTLIEPWSVRLDLGGGMVLSCCITRVKIR